MAPRLRKDLVATMVDEQGITCIEVTDPVTAINFRFYDFEYALAQELTGQPLEGVVAWAAQTYGVELSAEALGQFIDKLAGLGFLAEGNGSAAPFPLAPLSPPSTSSVPVPNLPMGRTARISAGMATPPARPARDGSGAGAPPSEPAMGAAPVSAFGGTLVSDEVDAVPSHLQALAGPLPPVPTHTAPAAASSSSPSPAAARVAVPPAAADQARDASAAAVRAIGDVPSGGVSRRETPSDVSAPTETPLGAIAHAIVAESSGPPPLGALDAAAGTGPLPARGAPAAAAGGSWATALADEVDSPRRERRQPPRPEVVVMPPVAEPSAALGLPRRRSRVWLIVLLLGCAAGAAVWFLRPMIGGLAPSPPPAGESAPSAAAPTVHVVAPQPTTFYTWFDAVGVIVPGKDDTLGFPSGGRVQDVMPPGTTFSAGETLARLQGVATREMTVNRLRARAAYAQQLRDRSLADGNKAASLVNEAKWSARKQELAAAQADLAGFEIHPKVPGEIAELLVQKGDIVKAQAPVFRIRAAGPRATFTFSAEDVKRARALAFCRLETIPGSGDADGGATESKSRAIDCNPSAVPAGGETRLAVDLIGATGAASGTGVRLASARYDGVFPVPRSALAHVGGTDRLWVVSGAGKVAESRAVEVAATVGDLVLVAHGVTVGDAVILDPPAGLKAGAEISVVR